MTAAGNNYECRTIDQIAHVFAVTPATVRRWIADGLPTKRLGKQGRGDKTRIDLLEASRWWFHVNRQRLELQRAQTRLFSERADAIAAENAETRRDLAPIAMIRREFGGLLTAICKDARKMSGKLVAELEGLDVNQRKATIDRAVYGFLDRAAVWEPGQDAR